MIVRRIKLFIDDLNYAPENISVLVPVSKDIPIMQEVLAAEGYKSENLIHSDEGR